MVDVDAEPIQEQIKLAGLVSSLAKGVDPYIARAMQHLHDAKPQGREAMEQASRETGGVAQVGAHGEPMAIVPHGKVSITPVNELTGPAKFSDIYRTDQLFKAIPELANITVKPDPKIGFTEGVFNDKGKGEIRVHPLSLRDKQMTARTMAHEGAGHAANWLTSGRDLKASLPLRGSDPDYFTQMSQYPLLDQVNKVYQLYPQLKGIPLTDPIWNDPLFAKAKAMMQLSEKEMQRIVQAAAVVRGGQSPALARSLYDRTYGEGISRWLEKPGGGREVLGAKPHTTKAWDAPRIMHRNSTNRLASQVSNKPSLLLGDDVLDLFTKYWTEPPTQGKP